MNLLLSQLRTELRLLVRQTEQVLVTIGIPVLILVFFATVDVLPTGMEDPVDFVTPGVLALAIMSTALVSLGINTGFERNYGVLKRLGASPLGKGRWVATKLIMVLLVEVVQWSLLIVIALALGWDPAGNWGPALVAALLGTAAFAGTGLLLAGTLPGMTNLAATNGLFLVLLLAGGMILPIDHLPDALAVVSRALPAAPLSDILNASFNSAESASSGSWITLGAWAVLAPSAAVLSFRWE